MATTAAPTTRALPRRRQSIRRGMLLISFLLFPVTMNYFSPYIFPEAMGTGILAASGVSFAAMFLSSLFLGRLWCGWGCPAGGLQDACTVANQGPARGGRWDWLKWAIWVPWFGGALLAAVSAGGLRGVDLLFMTETGISVDQPLRYISYYLFVGLVVLLSLLAGRRASCHYICWMAPFMILGRKLRNVAAWPSLRLKAESSLCSSCRSCGKSCPMSLDVTAMVWKGSMENPKCVLCGTCVDSCPKRAIRYSFSSGR